MNASQTSSTDISITVYITLWIISCSFHILILINRFDNEPLKDKVISYVTLSLVSSIVLGTEGLCSTFV